MTDRGTYVEHDGRPAVRFERTYAHSVDRVWRAITEPDELKRWFPSQVEHEGRVGGTVRLTGDPYAEPSTGNILMWEPPHRFGFEWGGDELHFTVTAADAGSRLELVNVLQERNAAARNGAGWYVCLVELAFLLDDKPGAGPHSDAATELWRQQMDLLVADGVPSGAEIPEV